MDSPLLNEGCSGTPLRVLLLGAGGFIGSHIHAALSANSNVDVIGLTRRPASSPQQGRSALTTGDITDTASLVAALDGVDVVVNAISYVGECTDRADQVNRVGTLNLISACRQAKTPRLIQLGTTAVYGTGPHRGASASEIPYHPESPVSVSRRFADDAVLRAGGTVVRASLVYGAGDRWFVPTLFKVFRTLGGTVEGSASLLSVIDAESLGEVVAGLAATSEHYSGAFHAATPGPVSIKDLLYFISKHISPLALSNSIPKPEAALLMARAGLSPHQIGLITTDHWYEASELWQLAGVTSQGLQLARQDTVTWYRNLLKSNDF